MWTGSEIMPIPNVLNGCVMTGGYTVIRAALYTEEVGQHRALSRKQDMIKAVDAAIAAGIYIIIDWHNLSDGNSMKYKSEALTFFREMAELYKNTPNVLYEICNEPNGDNVTWQGVVKPYAEEVISAIRQIDDDGVILVGTPNWSQRVDIAADDLLAFDNIMYVCHFYAGSHFSDLRDKVEYALGKDAAVFVTEWGTTANTGDSILYPEETFAWIDFMDEHKISWANWSITTRKESTAALKHTALAEGNWYDGDSWQLVKTLGSSESWTKQTMPLPKQADDNYFLQFRIRSAFGSSNASASLDDIILLVDRIK